MNANKKPVNYSIEDKPVQRMRPDESEESIMTPPCEHEVKESVKEMNPDEGNLDRG